MQTKNYFSILVLLFSISLSAQEENSMKLNDDGSNKNTRYTKLDNGVYYLQSDSGNIGVYYGQNDTFMVDSQTSTEINNNLKIIKRVSKKPIKYLVNTSSKSDHNGGNQKISKEGALILSHKITKDEISISRKSDDKKVSGGLVPANITFTENITIHYRKENIQIISISKNNGDLLVYFSKSNVLFTGDTFYMKNKYPLIDTDKGETLKKLLSGLNLIVEISNNDTKIVPGHGEVANIKEVNTLVNMLSTLYKQIHSQRANGKTLTEVLGSKSTITGRYDSKGYGDGEVKSDDIITIIYNELEKKMGPLDKRTPQEKANDRLKEMQKEKGKN